MTTVGLVSTVGYLIVGLKMAIPLGLLTGFAEIVPTLGPFAALVIALLFALTQSPGTVFGVLIVYSFVQLLESYVLLPMVIKKTTHIPPVVDTVHGRVLGQFWAGLDCYWQCRWTW